MSPTEHPEVPPGIGLVEEESVPGGIAAFRHPDWVERFPWLEHGITGRGSDEPLDFGCFGHTPVGVTVRHWRALQDRTGFRSVVHARQVHGAEILHHDSAVTGLRLTEDADGHGTDTASILLTVSVADCVPVYIVSDDVRGVALLHAGWRGIAAGMLEAGIHFFARHWEIDAEGIIVHFGPAICGRCYEVGAEVLDALGLPHDGASARLDLRAVLARRAAHLGVSPGNITVSRHCTSCGGGAFFSHRGGDRHRQLAYLGIRERRRG